MVDVEIVDSVINFELYGSAAVQDNLSTSYDLPNVSNADSYMQMRADGYITEIVPIVEREGGTIGIKLNGSYGFKMYVKGDTEFAYVNQWRIDNTNYTYMHNIRNYVFNDVFVIEVYRSYTTSTGTATGGMITEFIGTPLATYEWSFAGYMNDNSLSGSNAAIADALYNYACPGDAYIQWLVDNGYNVNI